MNIKDDKILERIKAHPGLRERFEAILDIAENKSGELITADQADWPPVGADLCDDVTKYFRMNKAHIRLRSQPLSCLLQLYTPSHFKPGILNDVKAPGLNDRKRHSIVIQCLFRSLNRGSFHIV